jgi:sensor histidine kinase YesM
VYALIIPLTNKFFSYRIEGIYKDIEELKKKIFESESISSIDLDELRIRLNSIEKGRGFPTYLGWGAGFTFFVYMLSTLLCLDWLADKNRLTVDSWIPFTFLISTISFLLLGIFSIKDISQTMKREFEDLKKKVEETENQTRSKEKRETRVKDTEGN